MKNTHEEQKRTVEFTRNQSLEEILKTLNNTLICAENLLLDQSDLLGKEHPVIFIMGPLRSGTTLFMQWLANSGVVAYPTNLLSRFYGAPVIGAQIQLLLTAPRLNFRNEILDFNNPISFESENGKTKGALAPNEFWYFWRRFLPFQELDWLPDEELFRVVDQDLLVSELTTLTKVFGKPFALKSMILNYNIPFLDAIFKKAIFVQIKRNPVTNVASILEARKRQLGNEKEWYSFKIPEYPLLKDLEPIMQAAGQSYYINKAVTEGINKVVASRKIVVRYEDFCQDPQQVYRQIIEKLCIAGNDVRYNGPEHFKISRNGTVPNHSKIEKALSYFASQ